MGGHSGLSILAHAREAKTFPFLFPLQKNKKNKKKRSRFRHAKWRRSGFQKQQHACALTPLQTIVLPPTIKRLIVKSYNGPRVAFRGFGSTV